MPPRVAIRSRPAQKTRADADPRFGRVIDQLNAGAARTKKHPKASKKVSEAAAAARPPANERIAAGKQKQVDKIGAAPEKPLEKTTFADVLRAEVAKQMPKTFGDTEKFMDAEARGDLKGALGSSVAEEKQKATGAVADASREPPRAAATGKEATPIPADPIPPAPRVEVAQAMPLPKPDADISLEDSKVDADRQLADARLTPHGLRKANDPRFTAVLDAHGDVAKHADAGPSRYRAQERSTLASTTASASSQASRGAAAMLGVRRTSSVNVGRRQSQQQLADERERAAFATRLERIYLDTKTAVDKKLETLDKDAEQAFDQGVEFALADMKAFVELRVAAYKEDRYAWRPDRRVRDFFLDLPEEVNQFYKEGRTRFEKSMDRVIDRVGALVDKRVEEAKDEVRKGQQAVAGAVAGTSGSLRAFADRAAKDYAGRFAELERGIDDRREQLAQTLAQKHNEALQKADAALETIREENRGLGAKLIDKVKAVVKALLDFKAKLQALVRKASSAIDLIVADPIGFLGNLIDSVSGGFKAFSDHFEDHLKRGFTQWLFGNLPPGIEVPTELTFGALVKLVMHVTGITPERLRAKAVRIVGERNAAVIDKALGYIRTLMSGGAQALWEEVKGDLADLRERVVDSIRDWLIGRIVKTAAVRIALLFNPVGAIVQAILTIYNVIVFVIEKAKQIFELVESVVNSIYDIATGKIDKAIKSVEESLARLVPLVIAFLAQFLNIGGIAAKVREFITKVQSRVDAAVDKLIAKALSMFRGAAAAGKAAVKKLFRIGVELGFTAGGEAHRLWVDQQSGEPMLASKKNPVTNFLHSKPVTEAEKVDVSIGPLRKTAVALVEKIAKRAGKILKSVELIRQPPPASADEPAKENATLTADQQSLGQTIIDILKKMGREPADPSLPPTTQAATALEIVGRDFRPYEANQNLLPRGYGVWHKQLWYEKGYPSIRVDAGGTIRAGGVARKADLKLIEKYQKYVIDPKKYTNAELLLDKFLTSLKSAIAPFAEGYRTQMKRAIEEAKKGRLIGVEEDIGAGRRPDLVVLDRGKETLVEVKHWTGKIKPEDHDSRLATLRAQFTAYIQRAPENGYDRVVVEFHKFDKFTKNNPTLAPRIRTMCDADLQNEGQRFGVTFKAKYR